VHWTLGIPRHFQTFFWLRFFLLPNTFPTCYNIRTVVCFGQEYTMSLVVTAQPIPLTTDADGVVRVGGTRVTLDTVIVAFREGATPETIAQQYPSVALADVYAVLGYYLRHIPEVHAYLQQREEAAARVRQENEARFDPNGVRDRLLARRTQQG
jgi:uncharacterized protein (DUF433 family)